MRGKTERAERVQKLMDEIGDRLRELRESRKETVRTVAQRCSVGDHGYLSRIEHGKANPTIDVLLELILVGLESDFETFCRAWVTDRDREREERHARTLLERIFLQGSSNRRLAIEALKLVVEPETEKQSQNGRE